MLKNSFPLNPHVQIIPGEPYHSFDCNGKPTELLQRFTAVRTSNGKYIYSEVLPAWGKSQADIRECFRGYFSFELQVSSLDGSSDLHTEIKVHCNKGLYFGFGKMIAPNSAPTAGLDITEIGFQQRTLKPLLHLTVL